jgi:putative flippase GtrA
VSHLSPLRRLIHEVARFGAVGVFNLVLQILVFNILRATVFKHHTVTANILSNVVATTSAYFMNKHWAFRHRERIKLHHEAFYFFSINAVAIGLGAGIIAFPHYALNLDGAFEDNVFNFVGIAVGTLLRFWAYRRFVWPENAQDLADNPLL